MKDHEYYKFQNTLFLEYYERVSNWQNVKLAPSGEAFIRIKGKIHTFTEFTLFGSPWLRGEPFEIKTENGKTATICAMQCDGHPYPYFLEVDEQNERARAFQLYKCEKSY